MIIMIQNSCIWFLKKKHHKNTLIFFWYGGAKNGSLSCLLKFFIH